MNPNERKNCEEEEPTPAFNRHIRRSEFPDEGWIVVGKVHVRDVINNARQKQHQHQKKPFRPQQPFNRRIQTPQRNHNHQNNQ